MNSMSELTHFTSTLLKEINLFRSDPSGYTQYLNEHLKTFVNNLIYQKTAKLKIKTKEGKIGVEECIKILSTLSPLPTLYESDILEQVCIDHVEDLVTNNIIGHEGSDGNFVTDRIQKYTIWLDVIGENIRVGNDNVRDIVIGWLIDDGNPSRSNRRNLLNKGFQYMGASLKPHPKYRYLCVTVFAHDHTHAIKNHKQLEITIPPLPSPSSSSSSCLFSGHSTPSELSPNSVTEIEKLEAFIIYYNSQFIMYVYNDNHEKIYLKDMDKYSLKRIFPRQTILGMPGNCIIDTTIHMEAMAISKNTNTKNDNNKNNNEDIDSDKDVTKPTITTTTTITSTDNNNNNSNSVEDKIKYESNNDNINNNTNTITSITPRTSVTSRRSYENKMIPIYSLSVEWAKRLSPYSSFIYEENPPIVENTTTTTNSTTVNKIKKMSTTKTTTRSNDMISNTYSNDSYFPSNSFEHITSGNVSTSNSHHNHHQTYPNTRISMDTYPRSRKNLGIRSSTLVSNIKDSYDSLINRFSPQSTPSSSSRDAYRNTKKNQYNYENTNNVKPRMIKETDTNTLLQVPHHTSYTHHHHHPLPSSRHTMYAPSSTTSSLHPTSRHTRTSQDSKQYNNHEVHRIHEIHESRKWIENNPHIQSLLGDEDHESDEEDMTLGDKDKKKTNDTYNQKSGDNNTGRHTDMGPSITTQYYRKFDKHPEYMSLAPSTASYTASSYSSDSLPSSYSSNSSYMSMIRPIGKLRESLVSVFERKSN